MSEQIFPASRIKLQRAKGFIAELAEYQTAFSKLKWQGKIRVASNGEPLFFAKPPPTGLLAGAIIGDGIHNMRTALDLMASDLARFSGQSVKNVYFPFGEDEAGLRVSIKSRFAKAGPDAVELLHSFKPYRGGNDDLRAIHDLDISDKHTALVPAAASLQVRVFGRYDPNDPTDSGVRVETRNVRFTFPEGSPFPGEPVILTLERLMGLVEAIITAFEGLVELRRAPRGY